jgi:integrase
MADMPHPRPPHLHRQISRHGKPCWYVRIGKGPRTRLRAAYGSPEFQAEYEAAVRGERPTKPGARAVPYTLRWLWESYQQTEPWLRLSPNTRYMRERIMRPVLADNGDLPFADLTKAHILAGVDRRAKTPAMAGSFLKTIRGMLKWAADREIIASDPSATMKAPRPRKNAGIPAWTREDVAIYQARWPLGTRQRVWLDVALYTGLRRGDLYRVGKQHARNGIISLRTQKGDETIEVTLPILPVLQRTLDAGPVGDLAWCCGSRGEPFKVASMGRAFAEAAQMAGIKKSVHGVRKIAAIIAADNGATTHELMAIFGWLSVRMAELYTREAERRRLASRAMTRLEHEK